MGTMNLDKVKADLVASINGVRKCLLEFIDFFRGHRMRLRVLGGEGDG